MCACVRMLVRAFLGGFHTHGNKHTRAHTDTHKNIRKRTHTHAHTHLQLPEEEALVHVKQLLCAGEVGHGLHHPLEKLGQLVAEPVHLQRRGKGEDSLVISLV